MVVIHISPSCCATSEAMSSAFTGPTRCKRCSSIEVMFEGRVFMGPGFIGRGCLCVSTWLLAGAWRLIRVTACPLERIQHPPGQDSQVESPKQCQDYRRGH